MSRMLLPAFAIPCAAVFTAAAAVTLIVGTSESPASSARPPVAAPVSTAPGDESPFSKKMTKAQLTKIHGKIQFVDSFPDYKVQVVDSFADLHVQKVTAFPDAPGKWQIVDSFPDHKIQIVNSFPDFKIKYVDAFPGVQ